MSLLMTRSFMVGPLAICLTLAPVGSAYKYPLQFSHFGYTGAVVAGYSFNNNSVIGDCSYYTTRTSGGRGSPPIYTYCNNTCTWDVNSQWNDQIARDAIDPFRSTSARNMRRLKA